MKKRYHISGMTCSACSSHVEKAVRKLEGVDAVSVNLLTETMDVSYEEAVLGGEEIEAAVEKAGYGASLIIGGANGRAGGGGRTRSAGTRIGQCSVRAGEEGAGQCTSGTGADRCRADGREETCKTEIDQNSQCSMGADKEELRDGEPAGERDYVPGTDRVGASRYEASSGRDSLQRKAREEAAAMKQRLGVSIAFLLPLMYVAMYHMYNEWFGIPIPGFVHRYFHGNENAMTFAMTQLLLLLPIVYMNRKFFTVGFKTLRHLSPNMDSLIALGASAAIVYGVFAMYRISFGLGHGDMAVVEQYSHDLYFESAGMILTLITVGKFLESRSKGKTSEAITKLMDLSPKTAVILDAEGCEREIPTQELYKGDIFLVKPGSLIPADGTVIEGTSSVDEAAITGESVPVEKQAGDKVVSATVNKAGFLKCRADRVGEDTTLSQIIRLVEEASASKAPIAQLADKVAGVFVPVVIGIALVTLFVWLLAGAGTEFAISTAIAVLVISCPCALGLATPVAIMVGTGVGAGHGILIKSGEALQQAREVDTVVLDKTGTITAGRLKCMQVGVWVQDMSVDTFVQIAAALEKKSEHPLAEAVVEHAASLKLHVPEVKDFRAVFGRGVEGSLAEAIPPRPMVPEEAGAVSVARLSERTGEAGEESIGGSETGSDSRAREVTSGEQEAVLGRLDAGAGAGTRYYVGNQAYLEEKGIRLDTMVQQAIDSVAGEGMTPLLMAEEGRFLGMIGVADEIKPTSREAIRKWKEMGIHVVMLTGDNRRTAEAVRQRLGIEEVVAQVLPQDKEKKISALRAAGHKVAMIGDGINDAPALAAADVGMAIGAGTDVAMESADIILMKSDLRDAVTAVRLSRAVIRNIKQNLFWAFFYNVIGIPLAAGVWYPIFGIKLNPMFGAAAMSLSSVFVVGNALRLKRFKSGFRAEGKETADYAGPKEGGSYSGENGAAGGIGDSGEGAAEAAGCSASEDALSPCLGVRESKAANGTAEDSAERKENMTKVMTIEGMMCGHCTGRVQKALEAVEGVGSVVMSLEEKTAAVEMSGEVADAVLKEAVTQAGYEVTGITVK